MAGRLTRFLNLERPRKASAEPAHEVVTPHRFEPEPEIQLSQDTGEQPFLRCPSCEADNGRFAERCTNCGVRLDTPEVRTWNDRLWESRKLEAAKADEAESTRQAQLAADQRAIGEAIAEQVLEREQARLGDSTPLGFQLLSRLEGPLQPWAVLGAGALFIAGAGAAILAHGHPMLRNVGGLLAALLASLFLPVRRRWR
jgi:hypothetical protein